MSATTRIIRGRVLSFTDDPAESSSRAYSYIEDGAVLVVGGLIEAVGAARDVDACERLGKLLGRDLALLGVTVNFAPVADCAVDPANTVVGTRAYGSDPAPVVTGLPFGHATILVTDGSGVSVGQLVAVYAGSASRARSPRSPRWTASTGTSHPGRPAGSPS